MATNTTLYNVLTGLNATDEKLWGKIKGLSGNVESAFTSGKLTIGNGSKLIASTYSIGGTNADDFGAANELATEQAVAAYIAKLPAGTALTGIAAATGSALTATTPVNNTVTIGLTTDGTTIGQDENGLKSLLTLKKLTGANSGYAASYQLQDKSGNALGDTINITKDQFLSGVEYVTGSGVVVNETKLEYGEKYLHFAWEIDDRDDTTSPSAAHTYVNVNELYDSYTGKNGVAINDDNVISAVVDPASEEFLTVSADGIKLVGVKDAIDNASANATGALTVLEARMTTAEDDISNLEKFNSNVLSGFSASKTVADEIERVASDGTTAVTTALSGVAVSGGVVVDNGAGKVKTSGYSLGTDGQTAANFGGTTNTLATEAATQTYVEGIANGKLDTISGGVTDNILTVAENGAAVADSGKKIGGATFAPTPVDTTVATEAGVAAYVNTFVWNNDGLSGLYDQIKILQGQIGQITA